jgi:hypothetical protein
MRTPVYIIAKHIASKKAYRGVNVVALWWSPSRPCGVNFGGGSPPDRSARDLGVDRRALLGDGYPMPDGKSMRVRRATVEHPFGTLKAWMGATHFKTRTLEKVRTEMSLNVLAYNLKRVIAMWVPSP